MSRESSVIDESLAQRLPLPLSLLFLDAIDARSPIVMHQSAYFLWEAALKFQAITTIACLGQASVPTDEINAVLKKLTAPGIGDWWNIVKTLLPRLAESNVEGFSCAHEFLLSNSSRSDLKSIIRLFANLESWSSGQTKSPSKVVISTLFDRLTNYRNVVIGHGAVGLAEDEFYRSQGRALLEGIGELLAHWDPLCGRTLAHVIEFNRHDSGGWIVEWDNLTGPRPRSREPLSLSLVDVANIEVNALPVPNTLYLVPNTATPTLAAINPLRPLALYLSDVIDVAFLNTAETGEWSQAHYLAYSSCKQFKRKELAEEQRLFLSFLAHRPIEEREFSELVADSLAGHSPTSVPESTSEPSRAQSTLPQPNVKRIGGYEVISELGSGGMGDVYRVIQPGVNRQVALKQLKKVGDVTSKARFRREIEAMGKIRHPNLARVYANGEEGDRCFFTMELIEGAPLSAICDHLSAASTSPTDLNATTWTTSVSTACSTLRTTEKSVGDPPIANIKSEILPNQPSTAPVKVKCAGSPLEYIRQVVELIRQVTMATEALHQANPKIIHRDIKPANIMVTADGQTAVLIDLGLAQVLSDDEQRWTKTREMIGTVRYVSPEQLNGGPLPPTSDVYSLGVTLWELLTLKPFLGINENIFSPANLSKVQTEPPEAIRRFNPAVPRVLEAIILKCVSKRQVDRYPTAQALADDLQRWLKGEPISLSGYYWRRWWHSCEKFGKRTVTPVLGISLALSMIVILVISSRNESAKRVEPKQSSQRDLAPHYVSSKESENQYQRRSESQEQFELLIGSTKPGVLASDEPAAKVRNFGDKDSSGTEQSKRTKRAILVGCTTYEHHPNRSLCGGTNDVSLLAGTLKRRFQFAEADLVCLVEGRGENSRPTRNNIVAAMRRLINESKSQDYALIYLAGHGANIKISWGPDNPALVGRIDLFLPTDVGVWDPRSQTVENAITYREVMEWIAELAKREITAVLIVDSCNDGYAIRSDLGKVSVRSMNSVDLKLPENPITVEQPSPWPLDDESDQRWVGLFATGPGEATFEASEREYSQSETQVQQVCRGVFTNYLCATLERTTHSPSYEDLIHSVQGSLIAEGWQLAVPRIVGPLKGRSMFDDDHRLERKYLLERLADRWTINGGRLQGLTVGSRLAAYDQHDDERKQTHGYVKIVHAGQAMSFAEPAPAPNGKATKSDDLHDGDGCIQIFLDLNEIRITVGVDPLMPAEDSLLIKSWLDHLTRNQASTLQRVDCAEAKWIIKPLGSDQWQLQSRAEALLQSSTGELRDSGLKLSRLENQFASQMAQVARVQSLLQLAQQMSWPDSAGMATDLKLDVLRVPEHEPNSDWKNVLESRLKTVRAGDSLKIRVRNTGKQAADITVLYVDSQFKIQSIFPRSYSANNRLEAGEEFSTPVMRVTADTTGREYVLLIAVKPIYGTPPTNYTFLGEVDGEHALHMLDRSRGINPPTRQFDSLVMSLGFSTVGVRGLDLGTDEFLLIARDFVVAEPDKSHFENEPKDPGTK